jgi:hypothetical protein
MSAQQTAHTLIVEMFGSGLHSGSVTPTIAGNHASDKYFMSKMPKGRNV